MCITNKQRAGVELKLELLLETMPVECKHYRGDEEPCLKFEKAYEDNAVYLQEDCACHCTHNCDGKIGDCDLFDSGAFEFDDWLTARRQA